MDVATQEKLRAIPALAALLDTTEVKTLTREFGVGAVKFILRQQLREWRDAILHSTANSANDTTAAKITPDDNGNSDADVDADNSGEASTSRSAAASPLVTPSTLIAETEIMLQRLTTPSGRAAINATGILLHTGLGRAPLCASALDAVRGAGGYAVLQTRLDTGKRSPRGETIEQLLRELTGCEAATLVNNNAAATMLALNTLAAGKEVIISRGQLIEIGGAFRMPDVMAASGARMVEVGTTNRTHLNDYEAAITDNTGAIIHVHTSNFRIRGFTGTPSLTELVELGRRHGIPVIDDLGGGALVSLAAWGLPAEPLIRESLQAGAAIVCSSGDKLIGGPQSGLLCGSKNAVRALRNNPLARMFRVCKLTEAALIATLLHFLNDTHRTAIPLYQQLSLTPDELTRRAEIIRAAVIDFPAVEVAVVAGESQMGGGTIPDEGLPTQLVRIGGADLSAETIARRLRLAMPATFGRIHGGRLCLDMRTVLADEVEVLAQHLRAAFSF